MLSEHVRGATPGIAAVDPEMRGLSLGAAVDALKRRMIVEAIGSTGSKTRAAERLGIPRQSLQKMMRRLGVKD
jgi:transcriptional regulator with GAF, ATPase, and Fis domain